MIEVCEAEKELAREIKLTDWSMAGNLFHRSSGGQIPRDICTRLKHYLYSVKCSWIIIPFNPKLSFPLKKGNMLRYLISDHTYALILGVRII